MSKHSVLKSIFAFLIVSSCNNPEKVMPYSKDGKWGLVNSNGAIIIEPKYATIDFSDYGRSLDLIKVSDSLGKTGYIDFSGTEIIPLIYDRGTNFVDEVAFVCEEGFYPSILDKDGSKKEVEGVMMASKFKNGYAVVQKARKYGFINKRGEIVIPPMYLNANGFSNGLAAIQCDQCFPEKGEEDSSFGKWGYIDINGKIEISPQFDLALDFDEEGVAVVSQNNKAFFINTSGKQMFNKTFQEAYKFSDGISRVRVGDRYGFIDLKGNELIPFIYSSASDFFDGYSSVQLNDGTWGVINKNGKFIMPPVFDELSVPFGGSVFYKKGNEKGLIDIESKSVLFSDLDEFYKQNYSDLVITSCKRDFKKIIKDAFSEDTFPYFPILFSRGVSSVERKAINSDKFFPYKKALISFHPNYMSENSLQENSYIFYNNDATLNNKAPLQLSTVIKFQALSGEEIDEIEDLIKERMNLFEGKINDFQQVNVDSSQYDTSLVWEYPDFFVVASYKWNLFDGGGIDDIFVLTLGVEFK